MPITNANTLTQALANIRLESLSLPKELNLQKLKLIHYYLFNDLYPWAGKTRSYPMRKIGDEFTPPECLPKYEDTVFARATEVVNLQRPEKDVRYLGIEVDDALEISKSIDS